MENTAIKGLRPSGARSIRLFLADGTPDGVIVAEVGNWVGKALTAPRTRLLDLLRRPECAQTGIYVLLGPDPERAGGTVGYIGEADDVAARLRFHMRSGDKDFFERAAVIVASDNNLTKGHVKYLEARLIRATLDAGSVPLTNTRAPDFQRLPEADRADMDYFLDQLRIVLPILSFDLFRGRVAAETTAVTIAAAGARFVFSPAGASAMAIEGADGFVVLAGSTARKGETGTFPAGYRALRDELLRDGTLIDDGEQYRFAQDVPFTSPSAAAAIVAGRSATGPGEWKVEGTGMSYRDWKAVELGAN
ncbi:MAG TPA: GIY-YIG nuclease family protein [Devosia sp.]|uniref:GIY-YIG nuclease family protein n=1 Tax=Devosia sp. TaxID=1871048 RepID=UPI002DDCB013|nr:GIY-YIG nuclease family protein [Devosia sp.]HEV2515402.1 GIY-YIG nuclease family protein [Devosia sp.]